MILYWLFFILVISFFTRHFNGSDKVKLWILILFSIYIIKKTKIIKETNKENLSQTIPISDKTPDNIIVDNKFNNFFNKLFIVGNRNTASQNSTSNKNIN